MNENKIDLMLKIHRKIGRNECMEEKKNIPVKK